MTKEFNLHDVLKVHRARLTFNYSQQQSNNNP